MAQLNFVQRRQIANLKGYSNFNNSARHDFFIKTISDVFPHASYKCPVNSCFEWLPSQLFILHHRYCPSYALGQSAIRIETGTLYNFHAPLTFVRLTLYFWPLIQNVLRFPTVLFVWMHVLYLFFNLDLYLLYIYNFIIYYFSTFIHYFWRAVYSLPILLVLKKLRKSLKHYFNMVINIL